MPQIAVFIEHAHVAGFVPAIVDVQDGLLEVVEIAFHHQVALDQDLALLAGRQVLAAVDVDDAHRHARQGFADAAGLVLPGQVDGDHRAGLGGAIALEGGDAVLALIAFAQPVGHLVGAHHDDAQGAEITGLGGTQIAAEKEWRGDGDGGPFVADDARHSLEFQRVAVGDGGRAAQQGQPEIGGLAVHMEQRQNGEEDVTVLDIDGLLDGLHIAADITVRQLDALGRLFAAAGEQDHQGVVLVALVQGGQQQRRGQRRLQRAAQFIETADLFHQVIDEQHVVHLRAADLFQHPARGDHRLEAAALAGVADIVRGAGGIVDHHRHLAAHRQRQHREHAAGRGGDHHAHIAIVDALELARQNQAADQRPVVGKTPAGGTIHQSHLVLVLFRYPDKLLVQQHASTLLCLIGFREPLPSPFPTEFSILPHTFSPPPRLCSHGRRYRAMTCSHYHPPATRRIERSATQGQGPHDRRDLHNPATTLRLPRAATRPAPRLVPVETTGGNPRYAAS